MSRLTGQEKFIAAEEEQERRLEKARELLRYMAGEAAKLREQGLPVKGDFRLDESAYAGVYTPEQLAEDTRYVEENEQKFHGGIMPRELEQKELATDGLQLELLKTILFHKKLGDRFAVVRAARHDDIAFKVDNVLMDLKSGNLVCALDEVSDLSAAPNSPFQRKRAEIRSVNEQGGQGLKYAIALEGGKIVPKGPARGLPKFLIALRADKVRELLFDTQTGPATSEAEEKFFDFMMLSLANQINELRLNVKDKGLLVRANDFASTLAPEMKKAMDTFTKVR